MKIAIPHSSPTLGPEEAEAASRVIASGRVAQGAETEAFEKECAGFVGRRYGVAVSSGTAALHLALKVSRIGPGDLVAMPSYACAALVTATHMVGARAALCDCAADFNVPADAYPGDARATIVAHLFGKTASFPKSGCIIEDIAQSIGGETGRIGRMTVCSFYATKLLTTGEGGMVLTDDIAVAEALRDLRDYDNRDVYQQRFAYKMTDVQAAIGRVQLRRLPGFIARRREIAGRYARELEGPPIELPDLENHVFFRYVIRADRRETLAEALARYGVDAKRPVYRPAHQYFKQGDNRARLAASYPCADDAHARALSLPIYPSLLDSDVDTVINSIKLCFC